MSSNDGLSEEVKCEDLVKVTIGDDPGEILSSRILTTPVREGGIGRVP